MSMIEHKGASHEKCGVLLDAVFPWRHPDNQLVADSNTRIAPREMEDIDDAWATSMDAIDDACDDVASSVPRHAPVSKISGALLYQVRLSELPLEKNATNRILLKALACRFMKERISANVSGSSTASIRMLAQACQSRIDNLLESEIRFDQSCSAILDHCRVVCSAVSFEWEKLLWARETGGSELLNIWGLPRGSTLYGSIKEGLESSTYYTSMCEHLADVTGRLRTFEQPMTFLREKITAECLHEPDEDFKCLKMATEYIHKVVVAVDCRHPEMYATHQRHTITQMELIALNLMKKAGRR